MRYLCLIYIEADKLKEAPVGECLAYARSLREEGRCHAAEALQAYEPATTLRHRNGKVSVTDGPFAETKELLAGFYTIEAHDLAEAIRIAGGIPPLRVDRVEVRPVFDSMR